MSQEDIVVPLASPGPGLVRPSARIGTAEWLAVAIALLVGGVLIAYRLGDAALWTDEFVTLITARRPLGDSLTQVEDQSAPLYQLLLRPALVLFGNSEFVIRAPAAVSGWLCIPASWLLARVLFGPAIAAPVGLLVAVNPWLVYHAREARTYTLFVLLSIVSMLFFFLLVERPRLVWAIGFVLAAAANNYAHYFGFLLLAAQLTYWTADNRWGKSRRRDRDWTLGSLLAAAAFSLPSLLLLARVLNAGLASTGAWVQASGLGGLLVTLGELVGIDGTGGLLLVPVLAAFWPRQTPFDRETIAGSLLSALPRAWRARRRAILCTLWILFGLGVVGVVSIIRPILVLRYVLPTAIPLTILGLASLARVGRYTLWMVTLVAGTSCAIHDWNYRHARPGMREAVALLNSIGPTPPRLLVADWSFCDDFIHPEAFGARFYGFKGPIGLLPKETAGLARLLDPNVAVWIISFQPHDNLLEPLMALGRPFRAHHYYLFRLYEVAPVARPAAPTAPGPAPETAPTPAPSPSP